MINSKKIVFFALFAIIHGCHSVRAVDLVPSTDIGQVAVPVEKMLSNEECIALQNDIAQTTGNLRSLKMSAYMTAGKNNQIRVLERKLNNLKQNYQEHCKTMGPK